MFHPPNAVCRLTSAIFFDKLSATGATVRGKDCMAENSLLLSTTADTLEQVVRLVDAGKLESGL